MTMSNDTPAGLEVTLLPCPFCGATDGRLVQAFTRATDDFAFWSVECLDCGCEIADDESQEKADTAWNTRAALPPARGEVELLVRDVERLASALEDIADRCRMASAGFNADKSVPSVKQMIALDSINGCVAHHRAGIELVLANARALAASPSTRRVDAGEGLTELDENGEAMVCTGCGTTRTIAGIAQRSKTAFSCCPERKMVPVRDMWRVCCDAHAATPTSKTCPFCTGAAEYTGTPEKAFCERHLRLYRKANAA